MKWHEKLKLMSLPLSILLLSYLAFLAVKNQYLEDTDSKSSRHPTSLAPARIDVNVPADDSKQERLKAPQKNSLLHELKKPHGALSVEISSRTATPLQLEKEFEIVGTVKIERQLGPVQITWHYPKDIFPIAPLSSPIILNLEAGDIEQVYFKFRAETLENRQIYFEASYLQNEIKMGQTAQYNTADQLNLERQALEQRKLVLLKNKSREETQEEYRLWQ